MSDDTRNPSDDAARPDGDPDVSAEAEHPVEVAAAGDDERYLRLAADFDNFRRRKSQELADRSRYASEEAAHGLIPVLDNLRRAVEHAPDGAPAGDLLEGLQLVIREFEAALARLGVTPVDSVGRPFDPAVHEALGGEEEEGIDVDTVSAELQRGYRLHDRLLRPALVRVAHPKPAGASA